MVLIFNSNGFDVVAFGIFVCLSGIYVYSFCFTKPTNKILIMLFAAPILCTVCVKITTMYTKSCDPNRASDFLYLSVMIGIMLFIRYSHVIEAKNTVVIVMGHTLLHMYFNRFALLCSDGSVLAMDFGSHLLFVACVSVCNYYFYRSLADSSDDQYEFEPVDIKMKISSYTRYNYANGVV
jgi:hypothetical protein